ncbi:MAG: ABC transporter ATP-binding protein/permease [Anaerococcus vaginalis]|nr:ABC transporter ATP-binding protein/permease [Anaerococcus vaginalis]
MFDRKLFRELESEKFLIIAMVMIKIFQLLTHVGMVFSIGFLLGNLILRDFNISRFIFSLILIIFINVILIKLESFLSYKASYRIKNSLRKRLLEKVFSFEMEYSSKVSISEVIALGVEGIEQLNLFYSFLLPQLLYSILGPVILFVIMSFINLKISLIMLSLIPLIPLAIMMVQKIAKKVVKSYWKSYTNMSNVFIDFLYGLMTLQVFNADEEYNNKLNEYAEDFRVKTMKLLFVQLNNLTVLDIVSYSGTALGIVLSLKAFFEGQIGVFAAFSFILLSQEFFMPLRRLGSLFHVAMNGISSANSLFEILEIPSPEKFSEMIRDNNIDIKLSNVGFSYGDKKILDGINMEFKSCEITAIVGKSGCGKSTIGKLIGGFIKEDRGFIYYNNLKNISKESLNEKIMLVDNNPYFFTESLRYNLQMANLKSNDDDFIEVLKKVGLYEYFNSLDGLDTKIQASASNLSGGQRQRLAIARVLLKKPSVLILDESISNIDQESEKIILYVINKLKKYTTIILITHRLNTVTNADYIYYLKDRKIVEEGKFDDIIKGDIFSSVYNYQRDLEMWGLNEKTN